MNRKLLSITVTLATLSTLTLIAPASAENDQSWGGWGFGNRLENLSVESQSYLEIPSINPESPVTVEVENMHILKLTIEVNEEVSNVRLTIQQLVENFERPSENFEYPGMFPPEEPLENFEYPGMPSSGRPQIAISPDVYQYFKFVVENITDAQIENVIIEFEVEKSWISEHSIDEENITFGRLENELVEVSLPGGEPITQEMSVVALPTSRLGEDATHIYFTSTSPSLSYFAITGESEERPPESIPGGPSESGPEESELVAEVEDVCDGDTIEVWITENMTWLDPAGEVGEYCWSDYGHCGDGWERVRFGGGIQAPESYEEGGPESTEFIENLIPPGTTVYIDLDNLAEDPDGRPYRGNYSRLIAVIYTVIDNQWVNVNAELLRWGMEAYPGNDWDKYTYIESEFSVYNWPSYDNDYPYVLGFAGTHPVEEPEEGESSGGSMLGIAMIAIVAVLVVVLFYARRKWV